MTVNSDANIYGDDYYNHNHYHYQYHCDNYNHNHNYDGLSAQEPNVDDQKNISPNIPTTVIDVADYAKTTSNKAGLPYASVLGQSKAVPSCLEFLLEPPSSPDVEALLPLHFRALVEDHVPVPGDRQTWRQKETDQVQLAAARPRHPGRWGSRNHYEMQ